MIQSKIGNVLIFSFLIVSNYSFSQTSNTELKLIKTNESGVQMYESGGVEGFKKTEDNRQSIPKTIKPIPEWTLEECDNALYGINEKINALEKEGSRESEIIVYRKSKAEILLRKEFLSK